MLPGGSFAATKVTFAARPPAASTLRRAEGQKLQAAQQSSGVCVFDLEGFKCVCVCVCHRSRS